MPKRHTPETVSDLFAKSSGNLAAIAEKTQQLQRLNQCLGEMVGVTIAQNCRVSNYKQGILTIETANSAFATRLNFMLPEILLNFRRNVLSDLIDMTIKVVPNEQFAQSIQKEPEQKRQRLSQTAAQSILDVSVHAPEKLKKTLERLAALQQK